MNTTDALQGIARLSIDTVAFIYFIERNPIYLARVLPVFQLIDAGTIHGFSSVISLTEVLVQPLRTGNTNLQQAYREILLSSSHIDLVGVNALVAEKAADLRARYKLRTPDALQIASGLSAQCQAFLTNDRGLQRVQDLPVLILDDLT